MTITKKQALAKYLNTSTTQIKDVTYDEDLAEAGGNEYLVLTDEEADDIVLTALLDIAPDKIRAAYNRMIINKIPF